MTPRLSRGAAAILVAVLGLLIAGVLPGVAVGQTLQPPPRPNTLALKRMPDDVPEEEKTRRIVALQALQKRIQGELFEAAIGRTEPVLVDARSRRREWELSGRTSGNTVVNFPGEPEWMGRIVHVTITGANPNSLRGEPCKSR